MVKPDPSMLRMVTEMFATMDLHQGGGEIDQKVIIHMYIYIYIYTPIWCGSEAGDGNGDGGSSLL